MEDMQTRMDRIYTLENYPEHLRKIIEILFRYEFSDGYEFYCDYNDIMKFAQEIYDLFNKRN